MARPTRWHDDIVMSRWPPRLRRQMSGLDGRRAIVTGGASGIGRAIAEDLAAHGARVLVTDINVEDGEAVAKHVSGVFVRADMSRREHCDAVVARAVDEWQGVDILVNNAGL